MDGARTDHDTEDLEALGEQIAERASHLDAATHRLLVDIRTFDAAGGWARQGARSCAAWLSWRLGWSGNRAREHVRVASALGHLPVIDDALRRGELSYCKARAMTRVATPDNEALLLEDAKHCTGEQLELICRRYAAVQRGVAPTPADDKDRRYITKRDREDGMVSIEASLHPEEAALLWSVLTQLAKERAPAEFSRADALVELAQLAARGTSPDRSPTDVVITVPVEALAAATTTDHTVATTPDGSGLTVATAFRLACDCGLVAMLTDAAGNALSVGRKTRSIPAATKRALLRRDRTCRFPGCCNTVFLDGHHATHWFHGGETSLGNLVSLCQFHHRFLHEYGYRVELDPQQQPRFFDAQGRLVPEVAPRPPVLDACERIERENAPLGITATTALPLWDGHPVNYEWVIDDLCAADRPRGVSAETMTRMETQSSSERSTS